MSKIIIKNIKVVINPKKIKPNPNKLIEFLQTELMNFKVFFFKEFKQKIKLVCKQIHN